MSITPLDSIRRAIARRNGVSNPAASRDGAAKAQGGRIENGLFPASHTAEELAIVTPQPMIVFLFVFFSIVSQSISKFFT